MDIFNLHDEPETIVSELTYINYASNRDEGMSAERLQNLYPETGEAMELRYQHEEKAA